ncbi:unnamed protein product [Paramecium sonneborni]|uniref:Uncharacterized protein n=1 Tax=Paramecium sonneborni TaxID=65129 RepID=A0A8S1RNY2_9CILI|nr:unnamed protein product [Paramecium sonneborni]
MMDIIQIPSLNEIDESCIITKILTIKKEYFQRLKISNHLQYCNLNIAKIIKEQGFSTLNECTQKITYCDNGI